jgi:hypothetical protein
VVVAAGIQAAGYYTAIGSNESLDPLSAAFVIVLF